jgi:hypothetical protein
MLATALSVSMFSTAGLAYTPEQQQACTGDAFQFCGPEIPDVDRVTACMIRQRALLSDGCKALFRMEPTAPATPVNYAPSARPSKPLTITPNKRG